MGGVHILIEKIQSVTSEKYKRKVETVLHNLEN